MHTNFCGIIGHLFCFWTDVEILKSRLCDTAGTGSSLSSSPSELAECIKPCLFKFWGFVFFSNDSLSELTE